MSININYHYQCQTSSRNCLSGCCNIYGGCSTIYSTCFYKYDDFNTNPSYYFPNAYNINCNSSARNCPSGCCQYGGNCATTFSNCYYTYSDYNINPTYVYSKYHSQCASYARNCLSGCCQYGGGCATNFSNCYWSYTDYNTNSNYTYSINPYSHPSCLSFARNCTSGCCTSSGYCATTSFNCSYSYYDRYLNSDYYYQDEYSFLPCYYSRLLNGKQCQPEMSFFEINKWYIIGGLIGYLLVFMVIAIICYCARKAWVSATNSLEAANPLNSELQLGQNTFNQSHRNPVLSVDMISKGKSLNGILSNKIITGEEIDNAGVNNLPFRGNRLTVHPFNDASQQELHPGNKGKTECHLPYQGQ